MLGQERAPEARELLATTEMHQFFISDFSLHSIGLLLFRRKQHAVFQQFLADMISKSGTLIASLSVEDMQDAVAAAQKFNLDFDDAYQYVIAEKYHLTLVSFDSGFDRTERGRKTPADIPPRP